MYEHRRIPPLSRAGFVWRFVRHFALAQALVTLSLGIGMAGYMYFENLAWRDAFVNAAMLLGGMGPVDPLKTDGGKIFAGLFALYAGLIFLIIAGVLLVPVVHRIVHRFHWEQTRSKR